MPAATPRHSLVGIIWTAVTAAGHVRLGRRQRPDGYALGNPVLRAEGRVTMVDGILATAVLTGLGPRTPHLAGGGLTRPPGYVLVYYALKEARTIHATSREA